MKTRIYYFSASGNSLHVARRLAESLDALPPETMAAAAGLSVDPGAEIAGLVFPVYLHRAPRSVLEFVGRSSFRSGAYIFAVATHNGGPGECMRGLALALESRGADLSAGFGLKMPGNSVLIADMTNSKAERADRLAAEEGEIRRISRAVAGGERNGYGHDESVASRTQALLFRLAVKAYRTHRHFRAGEACIGCGACARVCPRRNISLGPAAPVWGRDCELCLGCYHACPTKTVNLDDYTKGRLRYRHPEVSLEDLLLRRDITPPGRRPPRG